MRAAGVIALVATLALAAAGCATGPVACEKIPIVVAQKEARDGIEYRRSTRMTASGSIEEVSVPVSRREYRARADGGQWYQISEAEFEALAPGQRIEVCK